ncbi:MAG TPA: type IV pilus twitching motility protein PilT [Gemmatimonadales bacterium]|nr:type IV pilus twitching motility protein PilT [Gemmatimonadales bacterium]
MPRIDRFLTAMKQHGADSLRLGTGKPVRLARGGVLQPVTKDPLTESQVTALIKEIASPSVAPKVVAQARFTFAYESPIGPVEVALAPEEGGFGATLRSTGAGSTAAAPAAPEVKVAGPDLAGPRKELERLLRRMVESGGSDLHLRTDAIPLLRKDGELLRLEEPPIDAALLDLLIQSIMTPSDLESYRRDNDHDWAWEVEGVARFRANAGRDRKGAMAVFRQIPAEIKTVEDLGISQQVQALCSLNRGLVVVTGPTGSGKSTTLAAMVDLINRSRSDHIITIEDPIEFVHQSKRCLVTQRQVGIHTRSFKAALRAALREDPDVVLVGEMRDLETISIAIETAETGHLVLGTLHTTTAASTLDRIIDQFPTDRQPQIRVMLSESLRGVVAQVLCKKVGGGRVAAREVLLSIPAVSNLIREGKTFQIPSIIQTNRKLGMVTLNDALLEMVEAGTIEPKEAYLKSAEKTALLASLRAKGVNTNFLGEA